MTPAAYLHVGEFVRMQEAFWLVFGAHQGAIRALMDAIGVSEIAAGVGPAHGREKAASLTERLAHEVSILISVGRQPGWQPAAKVSMTIMRAPQHGHGYGSRRGVSGATSGCFCGWASGGATLRSARTVAMLSARLVEAKSP